MKKKVVAIVSVTIVALLAFAAVAQAHDVFVSAGSIYAKKMQAEPSVSEENGIMSASANSIQIPRAYYEYTVEELRLSGHSLEQSQELATSILLEKYSLYQAAVDAGCVPADDEVERIILDTRTEIETANNRTDFYEYLEGTGMTVDEYWESQFENIKMYAAIASYQEQYQDRFLKNAALTSNGSDKNGESVEALWEAAWNEHVSNIIANRHIVFTP